MLCPTCKEGIVFVSISVFAGSNDPRESYGPGLSISYTCNVCNKPVRIDTNKYPINIESMRQIIQKQLNKEGLITAEQRIKTNSSDDWPNMGYTG